MAKEVLISSIHELTAVAPLLAAIFAPFSVLFEIPATVEPWFIAVHPKVLPDHKYPKGIPDHPACLALSAIGLFFNVLANALLIVRFSAGSKIWRTATRVSVIFWVIKVIVALVNIIIFAQAKPGAQRGEGLWCALVSLIICGLISCLLLCHWAFETRDPHQTDKVQLAVRVAGRHFMMNVTFFVIDVGIFALIASQVEGWTYLQGIYFVTGTYLTIGFGDFHPTHAVTRVLLFIFMMIGIAQLENIVGMLVEFFRVRSSEKRAIIRAQYERERRDREERKSSGSISDLGKEIEILRRIGDRHEARIHVIQLGKSFAELVVFWLVGAAIFCKIEGWGYGASLYFAYVSFLTIGYGDLAPVTPGGRVMFIVYAIIGVPIMASFAVRAIQQVFSTLSKRQYDKLKMRWGLEPDVERHTQGPNARKIFTHAEFVDKWHQEWEDYVRYSRKEGSIEGQLPEKVEYDPGERRGSGGGESNTNEDAAAHAFNEDARLTEHILELALALEWRARKLIITHLETGAHGRGAVQTARLLLKADQNVQLREVKELIREIEAERKEGQGDREDDRSEVTVDAQRCPIRTSNSIANAENCVQEFQTNICEHEVLEEVRRYRQDFAGLLAAGSRLMRLKGRERALFERRSHRRVQVPGANSKEGP